MKYFLVFSIALAFGINGFAQNNSNKIIGIIYKKTASNEKIPVPRGATVFIPGIGSSTTDDKGYYSISLASCRGCKAGEQLTMYVNSKIGYAEAEYTVPTNPSLKPFDIGIVENRKLVLIGIIKDKQTGKRIQGLKVSTIIQGSDLSIPTTSTDERGMFQIIIYKEGILNEQAIQLDVSDAGNKYKDLTTIKFINQRGAIELEMEECIDCGNKLSLDINTYVVTNIKVNEGDVVVIKASGVIRVGGFVGNSGPEGIPNNRGVLGLNLEQYNYFKLWNHAVLCFRFGKDDEWKFYDSNKKENKYSGPKKGGNIEFCINDNQQEDNEGSYNVDVIVRK